MSRKSFMTHLKILYHIRTNFQGTLILWMPQIQYFHDFIIEDDLPIKFHGYHTYLIYRVAAVCNMAKDLAKDITYYFE